MMVELGRHGSLKQSFRKECGFKSLSWYKKKCFNMDSEYKDKCDGCPFNDTSCPGGAWCNEEY